MVHPDKNYTYWRFCRWPAGNDSIVFSSGIKPTTVKFDLPKSGLFIGCLPVMCFSYIDYVYKGKVGHVTTAAELKQFLGRIDNLEEALLLAKESEDVFIDPENSKGGAYFIGKNGFHLLLMRYNNCPETKESIFLRIEKDSGIVKKVNLGAYYKSKTCIMY